MRRTTLLALAVVNTQIATAQTQSDFDNAVIGSTDLGSGIHMVTGVGGNIGLLVGPDGALMIDDQYAEIADRIEAKIDEIAPGPEGEVVWVVNTHYHFDHAGGNVQWHNRGATIVAHDNVRVRLVRPGVHVLTGEPVDAEPPEAWPVFTFPDTVTFHMNGQTVHVRHLPPAHTDGDSYVYFEEADILHMGDVYMSVGFPFVDLRSGGSINGFIAAREAAANAIGDDTVIIPGHGPLSNKAELLASVAVLRDSRDKVQSLMDEGLSLAQVVAANPLSQYDAVWGQGFINTEAFTTAIYNSLSTD